MIVRTVNYQLASDRLTYRFLDSDGVVRTRNYLVDLDPSSLAVTEVQPLAMVLGHDARPGPVVGLEDARLIELDDRWVVSATVRDRNDAWRCEIAVATVDPSDAASEILVLPSPVDDRHEKNWMPFYADDALHFVYSLGPTVVLRVDERTGELTTVATRPAPDWTAGLRGGSQALRVDDGYVFVAHEVQPGPAQRDYVHRLVHLTADWQFDAVSPAFRFLGPGVEFCAGIARLDNDVVMSFGSEDRAAYLIRVPLAPLLALLTPISDHAVEAAQPLVATPGA